MANLDTVLELIRAGKLDFSLRYIGKEESLACYIFKRDVPFTEELLEVIRTNQTEILQLVMLNDVTVCSDFTGHASYHKPAIWLGGGHIRCEECASIREQAKPTDEDLEQAYTIDIRSQAN